MTVRTEHEFRDPIHGFIICSTMERDVINSCPFQRLRHIHQLAMTYLVYPGATHRRFEHSLGVMHLASRIFDVLLADDNTKHLPDFIKNAIPELQEKSQRDTWKRTLRMAALLHDVGHLPFSHGAEKLLPDGCTHETMTWRIITSDIMTPLLKRLQVEPTIVAKLAVGQKDLPKEAKEAGLQLSTWESLLSEIIVGDAFGADRMDYLLRDSHHLGVSYGHFDLDRIISSLRIGYRPPEGESEEDQSAEPMLGVDEGGLYAAGALLWARYSIFSQVYFHHVRRIYDIHFQDFLKTCYPEGYPITLAEYLALTDNELLAQLSLAARSPDAAGHKEACAIVNRQHFKKVYRASHSDRVVSPVAVKHVFAALCEKFGSEYFKWDDGKKANKYIDFPIILDSGTCRMVNQEMTSINSVPPVTTGYVFVSPNKRDVVKAFVTEKNVASILRAAQEA